MTRTDNPPSARHLLLIEDDDALRRALQLLLTGQGYRVHSFSRPMLALEDPEALASSHLVIDYVLPDSDGIGALRFLREQGWAGCAVMVTAFYSQQLRDAARAAGFAEVLPKPFRDANLIDALARGAPAAG